jgi:sulfoxide reductase catalytic subunit YedY
MSKPVKPSEITSETLYTSRRRFIKDSISIAAASLYLSACQRKNILEPTAQPTDALPLPVAGGSSDEIGNPLTTYDDIISYTNYYEFSTDKSAPTRLAQNFSTSPWTISVSGYVSQPRTFDMDDIRSLFEQEERIYRMRCVEAWSMVIPWIGFPLRKLLELVEPTSDAKYVRFETIFDPDQMPGQAAPLFPFPYIEGLRMDEAMHDLTLLATGLYGRDLSPQNGAPIRLVVPWKYGFKSIKSIVKIDLVGEMPTSLWMAAGPSEYGFYANVNPNVSHPRWSQATERRIGDSGRIDTLLFNGYEQEVAYLYDGMDLSINY